MIFLLTRSFVLVPHRALNNLDTRSLPPQTDRTIPKPRHKGMTYRKVTYIENFIFQTRSDLKIKPNDNASEKVRKELKIQDIVMKLNSFTRTCTLQLVAKIKALNLFEGMPNWTKIPDHLKVECYTSLELLAKKANISLDRCIDSWAANILISTRYPDAIRTKLKVSFHLKKCLFQLHPY